MTSSGEFYVDANCCLSCGVPHDIAPDLFGWSDEVCYVARQPTNERETSQMVEALWSSEASCIRYAGHRDDILRRIAEVDMAGACDDDEAVNGFSPVDRSYAEFESIQSGGEPRLFADRLAAFVGRKERYRVRRPAFSPTTVKLSWWKDWHRISFGQGRDLPWTVSLRPTSGALVGLRRVVQDWADSEAIDLIWYGKDRRTGQDAPARRGIF
jgi:hypothetical protein